MELNNLYQKDVAALFFVTDRTVRDWHREDPPIPSHGTGRALRYIYSEVFPWWKEREFKQLTSALRGFSGGDDDDYARWEHVEKRADAEMKLLKLADARRMSLPADEVERRWSSAMSKVRTQLLNIRNRMLAKFGREVADAADEEIKKACSLLSEGHAKKAAS